MHPFVKLSAIGIALLSASPALAMGRQEKDESFDAKAEGLKATEHEQMALQEQKPEVRSATPDEAESKVEAKDDPFLKLSGKEREAADRSR